MDMQGSIGGLIPLWILGAPLVAGLIEWMRMPKTTTRNDADTRSGFSSGTTASLGNR
jgi:hypothetical protein